MAGAGGRHSLLWLKVAVASGTLLAMGVAALVWHLHRRVATLELERGRLLTDVARNRVRMTSLSRTTLVRLQHRAGVEPPNELGFIRADVTQADIPWLLPGANGGAQAATAPEVSALPANGRIAIPLPDLAGADAALLMVNAWVRTSNDAQAKDETLAPIALVLTGDATEPQRIEIEAQFFQVSQLRALLSSVKTAASATGFVWRPGSTLDLDIDLPALRYNLAAPAVSCDVVVRVAAVVRLGAE